MSGTERLYTPQLLSLAVKLADYPMLDDLPHKGEARSRSCGSTLLLGLDTDADGAITRIGMRVLACAVGQASAAIFADAVIGRDATALRSTHAAIREWLSGHEIPDFPLPDWPGIAVIEAARVFPARHGAILLPWEAALAALSIDHPNA